MRTEAPGAGAARASSMRARTIAVRVAGSMRASMATIRAATAAALPAGKTSTRAPGRRVAFRAAKGLRAVGDATLIRVVLQNLLGNAWKYSSKVARPEVEFGAEDGESGREFFVRDNGAGFDAAAAETLFAPFQRFHASDDFPGTGVGLATVKRIVERHGGRIRAESRPGRGATVRWTLPDAREERGAVGA